MTMIPILLSAIMPAPAQAPVAACPRSRPCGSYNPGGMHRPVAAMFAVGLPAALVVAVALSPMVVPLLPRKTPPIVTSIPIEKPEPVPPPPNNSPLPPPQSAPTVVAPLIAVPNFDPPLVAMPMPLDPPINIGPINTGPPVKVAAEPKLVAAKIDPRYANLFQPDYPASEQRNGVEGMVKVRVLIGADGRVKAVEQVGSASPGFFAETKRRAITKWRFKPATRDGIPYESWQVMTVRFELRGA